MIRKLRIKFILLSMFSLLLVLMVIMGTVSVLNYRKIVANADSTLAILRENDGRFPKPDKSIGDWEKGPKGISPELPYESRYFSVRMDAFGMVISADTGKIAAVDTATAMEFAQTVWEEGKEKGFVGEYRYVTQASTEDTQIIFLDCGRSLSTFRSFVFTSCWISLLGLLAVLILLVFLSARIVKPVAESYEKQKRFITDAGHEIKTPITIIDADAEVLELDLGENEWLRDIRIQAKRLAALTNDLIFLSRMEEEQVQLQMIEFPFSDLVSETAQSFQALAKAQNKTFTVHIQPMISLYGDEKALRQLVSILLDNALKYSEADGDISLSLKKEGKTVCLSVYNTTASVSREQLSHLFDRFYRADPSRNSRTGGYGIGLSIAKAVVSAHRGKITAHTQDGHSLLVTVLLPV